MNLENHRLTWPTYADHFKNMMKDLKNLNRIVYLKGIYFSEIESIVQFIYLGEATVNRERMDEFLAVANSLEIDRLWWVGVDNCRTEGWWLQMC